MFRYAHLALRKRSSDICRQAVSLPIAGALTVADAAAIARIINDLEI